jgi:hypothetical protein
LNIRHQDQHDRRKLATADFKCCSFIFILLPWHEAARTHRQLAGCHHPSLNRTPAVYQPWFLPAASDGWGNAACPGLLSAAAAAKQVAATL